MGRGKRGNVVQGLILNFFFVPVFCETAKFNSRLIDAGGKGMRGVQWVVGWWGGYVNASPSVVGVRCSPQLSMTDGGGRPDGGKGRNKSKSRAVSSSAPAAPNV